MLRGRRWGKGLTCSGLKYRFVPRSEPTLQNAKKKICQGPWLKGVSWGKPWGEGGGGVFGGEWGWLGLKKRSKSQLKMVCFGVWRGSGGSVAEATERENNSKWKKKSSAGPHQFRKKWKGKRKRVGPAYGAQTQGGQGKRHLWSEGKNEGSKKSQKNIRTKEGWPKQREKGRYYVTWSLVQKGDHGEHEVIVKRSLPGGRIKEIAEVIHRQRRREEESSPLSGESRRTFFGKATEAWEQKELKIAT